ncbi:MAG: acylphosphatase [Alphaproteobacteria bacterium]
MSEPICIRVVIRGRVQGVYYRAWTVGAAKERGLTGWVRNRSDGSVEAVLCGPAERVEDMLEACKEGPPSARVADIERAAHDDPPPAGFRKLDTV